MTPLKTICIGIAIGIITGVGGGWMLWRPKVAPPETYAAPVRQGDSSLVLERKPDPTAKPAQDIPKGGTVERVVQVTVQPKPVPASSVRTTSPDVQPVAQSSTAPTLPENPAKTGSDSLICPPVKVDLSLVRMKDQSRRVVASSPDGSIVGGVDIPVEPIVTAKVLKWAAGGLYDPINRTWGGFVDRDLGPLRLGVEGVQLQPAANATRTWAAQVRVGIRF